MDNRHPADELAEVRNEIRELKEQEEELRTTLLNLPTAERAGRTYTAVAMTVGQRWIDVEKLEKELGDISRFYTKKEFVTLRTRKNAT